MAPSAPVRGRSSSATRPGSASSSASPTQFIARRLPGSARGGSRSARRLCRSGRERPDVRPERDHRREHGGARARPAAGRRSARNRPRVRRVRPHVAVAVRADAARATSARRSASCSSTVSERTRAVFLSHITSETGAAAAGRGDRRARRAQKGSSRSSTARTRSRRSTSTSPRSARTSTPATATSGCARRRAPASSTCTRTGRSASTARSSAGATANRRRSSRARSTRERATPAAYLAVPDAIAFQREHDVREQCVALAREARKELCALLGTEPTRAGRSDPADGKRAAAGDRSSASRERALRRVPHRDSRRWVRAATTCCASRSRRTRSGRTSSACSTPSRDALRSSRSPA